MMIIKEDNSRIIGDFLEINGNIIYQKQSFKGPKFIANMRYKYYRKKLIKLVYKFEQSNYILTKDNLIEFFAYTYNNFSPTGEYDIVKFSKFTHDRDDIEACLKFTNDGEEFVVVITIIKDNPLFEINVKKTTDKKIDNISVNLSSLSTKRETCMDTINKINIELIKSISKYIMSILDAYN